MRQFVETRINAKARFAGILATSENQDANGHLMRLARLVLEFDTRRVETELFELSVKSDWVKGL